MSPYEGTILEDNHNFTNQTDNRWRSNYQSDALKTTSPNISATHFPYTCNSYLKSSPQFSEIPSDSLPRSYDFTYFSGVQNELFPRPFNYSNASNRMGNTLILKMDLNRATPIYSEHIPVTENE